jgi:hypothetical protein
VLEERLASSRDHWIHEALKAVARFIEDRCNVPNRAISRRILETSEVCAPSGFLFWAVLREI